MSPGAGKDAALRGHPERLRRAPPTAMEEDSEEEPDPRVKPAVPGADLEVDIVPEGVDPLAREQYEDPYAIDDDEPASRP